MPRSIPVTASLIALASPLLAVPASAQPTAGPGRAALIIGSANYTALPPLPACAKSANMVAAAARALGFQVIEQTDASTGAIDGALGDFSQHLSSGGVGLVYVCGYATDFNNRGFLLPIDARIERPSDLLTQGLLAKSLIAALAHDPATVGVAVFDMVTKPGDQPPAPDALAALPVPDGVGVVAATETSPPDAATLLSAALAGALKGPTLKTEDLMAELRGRLASSTAVTTAFHVPTRSGLLAGAAPPPAAPSPAPPPPAAPPVAAAPPPPAPTPPVAAAPAQQLPDEAQMTEFDRRAVQSALVRLGYYDATVDGAFGPETRAAIRRFQHEIGAEMTGQLTAAQATRLVNTH